MLVIPQKQAESLRNTGEETLQPEGTWRGTIEDVLVRNGPPTSPRTGALLKGYVGPEAKRLTLVVGDNQPLDGQADWGARKRFVDIVLEDGAFSLEETPFESIPNDAWQLQRSARIVANLAAALGQITLLDDGNAMVNEGFLDALESGIYKGGDLGYVVYHRKGTDGVVRAELEQFMA